MKYGVNLKIDVTKINKEKLFKGKNGAVYLDATVFIDIDNQDDYGNNGMITQAKKKDDTEKGAILGNAKVFWTDNSNHLQQRQQQASQPQFDSNNFDDDIPF